MVVASVLQSHHSAIRHVVVVADNQLDHVAVAFVVHGQDGLHLLRGENVGPAAVGVNEVFVGVGGVVELNLRLARGNQRLVGVFHSQRGTSDSFLVSFVALERDVGNLAVAVEVDVVVMLNQILTNQLALHTAGVFKVGADERGSGVAQKQVGGFFVAGRDRTVEPNGGDARSLNLVHDGLRRADGAGLNEVHHNSFAVVVHQSRADEVGLYLLVAVGVGAVDRQVQLGEISFHFGTHGGKVHVAVGVPGHIRIGQRTDARKAHHDRQQQSNEFLHYRSTSFFVFCDFSHVSFFGSVSTESNKHAKSGRILTN